MKCSFHCIDILVILYLKIQILLDQSDLAIVAINEYDWLKPK